MRTPEEILGSARDEPPFANGTEFYAWTDNWCFAPCRNPAETAWQRYENGQRKTAPKDYPGGCPLIQAALLGKTPVEWLDTWDGQGPYPLGDRYHCIEFRGPDGRDEPGPPRPRREPPNMDGLFERPPRTLRLFKQPDIREAVLA